MAPEQGRNVRNKLVTITLAVISVIKILASSQLYRLPKYKIKSSIIRQIYCRAKQRFLVSAKCFPKNRYFIKIKTKVNQTIKQTINAEYENVL